MKKRNFVLLVLLAVGTLSCVEKEIQSPMNLKSAELTSNQVLSSESLDLINDMLEMQDAQFRIAMAEPLSSANGEDHGAAVFSKFVGNKKLASDFVPGDPRRSWNPDPNTITYAIDQGDAAVSGLDAIQTTDAIERGFGTWDMVDCSELGLTRVDDEGLDLGYWAYGWFNTNYPNHPEIWQGSPAVIADIQQAGWGDLPLVNTTLGVTITYIWVANNEPTDINEDGLMDVAFRETYYNSSKNWGIASALQPGQIEVETVAVHEIGHCLSQAHFGTLFFKQNGTVQAAPRAVMNAVYLGVLTELQGPDLGGHCGIWDDWPLE